MNSGQAPRGTPRRTRREIAAEATRREILQTARRLFAANGFGATSVQQIADEAGVAVQTIYSSVGSKSKLVVALNDLIDEEADVSALARAIGTAPDPDALLAAAVHLTRQLNERCGDIVRAVLSAAADDPDAAAALADGLGRHRAGCELVAGRLGALGALAPGVDEAHAASVLTMMTAPASFDSLVRQSGWAFDDAEAWLVTTLRTALVRAGEDA